MTRWIGRWKCILQRGGQAGGRGVLSYVVLFVLVGTCLDIQGDAIRLHSSRLEGQCANHRRLVRISTHRRPASYDVHTLTSVDIFFSVVSLLMCNLCRS